MAANPHLKLANQELRARHPHLSEKADGADVTRNRSVDREHGHFYGCGPEFFW